MESLQLADQLVSSPIHWTMKEIGKNPQNQGSATEICFHLTHVTSECYTGDNPNPSDDTGDNKQVKHSKKLTSHPHWDEKSCSQNQWKETCKGKLLVVQLGFSKSHFGTNLPSTIIPLFHQPHYHKTNMLLSWYSHPPSSSLKHIQYTCQCFLLSYSKFTHPFIIASTCYCFLFCFSIYLLRTVEVHSEYSIRRLKDA